MFRSTRRRLRRRLLTAAVVGAAVLVPSAQAIPTFDVGGSQLDDATGIPYQSQAVIPYLSHGEGVSADALARELGAIQREATPLVRPDGADGVVASEPVLRREAPDGYVSRPYVTEAPSTPTSVADSGWNLDWTAIGLGVGLGFLLAALLAGGAGIVTRGRMAKA